MRVDIGQNSIKDNPLKKQVRLEIGWSSKDKLGGGNIKVGAVGGGRKIDLCS